MTPEGRVKIMFKLALAAAFGGLCWRFMPVQTGFGSVAHDFILCVDGLFFSVETKASPKHDLTPLQKTTKEAIEHAGGTVLIVNDEASVQAAVERIKWECNHYGRPTRSRIPAA